MFTVVESRGAGGGGGGVIKKCLYGEFGQFV